MLITEYKTLKQCTYVKSAPNFRINVYQITVQHNRSVSIPRSGSVARHESCCKPWSPCTCCLYLRPLLKRINKNSVPYLSLTRSNRDPMTLIQRSSAKDNMDGPTAKVEGGKSTRPVRNRRYTRRSLVAGQRPQKRLFTPEIKRYLKDWLVRRRENPYPNREEKKYLSRETGLTYIQICNWFANWRRKLKNVNIERNQQTWGHLIRTYNDRAQGNVEHFSICSDDSIWSEPEPNSSEHENLEIDAEFDSPDRDYQQEESNSSSNLRDTCDNNNSYSVELNGAVNREESKNISGPMLLSKWLESAARFQPSENNYSWWADEKKRRPESKIHRNNMNTMSVLRHDRDEVEAAVALTALASATSRLTATP